MKDFKNYLLMSHMINSNICSKEKEGKPIVEGDI